MVRTVHMLTQFEYSLIHGSIGVNTQLAFTVQMSVESRDMQMVFKWRFSINFLLNVLRRTRDVPRVQVCVAQQKVDQRGQTQNRIT